MLGKKQRAGIHLEVKLYFINMGLSIHEVLQIYAEVPSQLKGNFKHVLDKIPESDFESFTQYLSIPESNYKLLLTFLANNWETLGTRSKEEILYDLKEPLKTYLSKNDQYSLKKLTLKTLNEYKGIKKEVGTGASGWQVIEITDPETCVRLTEGSGWCVQEYPYAREYLESGKLYLIVRDGKRFALIHFESDSYMDPQDNPLKINHLKAIKDNLPQFCEDHPHFQDHYSHELQRESEFKFQQLIHVNDLRGIQEFAAQIGQEISIKGIVRPQSFLKAFRQNPTNVDVVKYLIDSGLMVHNPLPEMIPFLEMERGDTQKLLIKTLVYAGVDLDSSVNIYGTALFTAASRAFQYIVLTLLDFGCNPNARNRGSENTPLHGAALKGGSAGVEIAKLLIDSGAEINAVNVNGYTPLDYAKSEEEMIEFLKSYGGVSGELAKF